MVYISLDSFRSDLKAVLGGLNVILFFERQNFGHYRVFFAIVSVFCLFSLKSFAINTSLLPEGIYSPALRYGHINGLDQRYNDNGTLISLTDFNAIELDAKTLSKFNSEAKNLVTSLNRFGAFRMGDSLNLGTLEIQAKPQIDYTAPIFAKGITKNWTVGIGLPVIHYQNQVTLSQSFSNIDYYRQQFSGLSTELDQALQTNLGESTQQILQNKGYSRLEDRNEHFLGDAQIVSLYQLQELNDLSIFLQSTAILPTGPKYNPNDLLALNNSFHKASIENAVAFSYQMTPSLKITPYVSFKYTLPETIDARVPADEDDILPDQNSIESVSRKDGLGFETGLQNILDFTDSLQMSLDYRIGTKEADQFSGDRNSRYDLLSKNTLTKWQKAAVGFAYSSVKSYMKTSKSIPFIASVTFFDTLAGLNIERRFGQELSLTLFF